MSSDILFKVIDQFYPDIINIANDAKLFIVDADDFTSILNKKILEYDDEYFFLPFKQVIIELDYASILIWDETDQQIGLDTTRQFIMAFIDDDNSCSCISGYIDGGKTVIQNEEASMLLKRKLGAYIILNRKNNEFDVRLRFDKTNITDDVYKKIEKPLDFLFSIVTNFMFAIFYLNSPSRFIVEECNDKPIKGKLVQRRQYRSKYILLSPNEIKKRYLYNENINEDTKEIQQRAPHFRRRHQRTLQSERYKNKKGERIVVKECWIGKNTFESNGKKYIVHFEL